MIEVKSQEILLTVDGATLRVGVTYHTPMVMAELPEIRLEVVGDGSPLIPISQVDEAIGFAPPPDDKPAKRRRKPKKPIAKYVPPDPEHSYQDYVWLYAAYVERLRTVGGIADQCGVSIQTIRNWLKKFGIKRPRHPRGEGNIV